MAYPSTSTPCSSTAACMAAVDNAIQQTPTSLSAHKCTSLTTSIHVCQRAIHVMCHTFGRPVAMPPNCGGMAIGTSSPYLRPHERIALPTPSLYSSVSFYVEQDDMFSFARTKSSHYTKSVLNTNCDQFQSQHNCRSHTHIQFYCIIHCFIIQICSSNLYLLLIINRVTQTFIISHIAVFCTNRYKTHNPSEQTMIRRNACTILGIRGMDFAEPAHNTHAHERVDTFYVEHVQNVCCHKNNHTHTLGHIEWDRYEHCGQDGLVALNHILCVVLGDVCLSCAW